ncbi:MAG: hypothetical protein LBI86_08810 [Treponema sp.]|jgi:hypothetical protein|nr:hypothetical protein [Treponema sp.]
MKQLPVLMFSFFVLSGGEPFGIRGSPILGAQSGKPVIVVLPFSIEGISAGEGRLLQSLIRSYLSELGEVIDVSPEEGASPGTDAVTAGSGFSGRPDFTVSGSIRMEGDFRTLTIDTVSAATGETRTWSYSYKTTGELVLKARSVLETAFIPPAAGQREPVPAENISENRIMGSWKGETGIETVRLYRGGRGMAVFSSGAQMALSYTIDNNSLMVRQVSPNSERYYYPLPYEDARTLSAGAEPMIWELRLYGRGSVLRGIKTVTGFHRNGDERELIPEIQDVEWTKGPGGVLPGGPGR